MLAANILWQDSRAGQASLSLNYLLMFMFHEKGVWASSQDLGTYPLCVNTSIKWYVDVSCRARCQKFILSLHLSSYFVYASSKGSGQFSHLPRPVWSFVAWQCDKYSKTCVKWPLSKRPKTGFKDHLLVNAGQAYCRMLQGEHSAILLTFINLKFVIKIFVLSIWVAVLHRFYCIKISWSGTWCPCLFSGGKTVLYQRSRW